LAIQLQYQLSVLGDVWGLLVQDCLCLR